jgi:hypothetical protein
MKTSWHYYALLLLIVEKIIQHIFVTLAFYFNWGNIASTVAVSPTLLMVAGAFVAILFLLSLGGLLNRQMWTINLVVFLALFDIVGEFVAQGRIGIVINVSFIVATLLLILALMYHRQTGRLEQ